MARPPGSAYLGTDLPPEDLLMPAGGSSGASPMPPSPAGGPGSVPPPMPDPSGAPPLTGGYEDDPEIIAEMAESYMGIPRAQLDAMPPDQYAQLLDELEQGYPNDTRLIEAISRVRPHLLSTDPNSTGMPLPPEAPAEAPLGAPPGVAPPSEPSFRPDRPY